MAIGAICKGFGQIRNLGGEGSIVSYYDGTTLLGKEIVAKGEDCLHPKKVSTTKSGYTLIGYGTSDDVDSKVTTYLATGKSMTLYALYLPNSFVVYGSGAVSDASRYISGKFSSKWTGEGSKEVSGSASSTATLTSLTEGMTVTVSFGYSYSFRWSTDHYGRFNICGNSYSTSTQNYSNTVSVVIGDTKTLTTYCYYKGTSEGWAPSVNAYITQVTLSNPAPWT